MSLFGIFWGKGYSIKKIMINFINFFLMNITKVQFYKNWLGRTERNFGKHRHFEEDEVWKWMMAWVLEEKKVAKTFTAQDQKTRKSKIGSRRETRR